MPLFEDETLDHFDGEGEERTVTERRQRFTCWECGETAHYRITYLMEHARTNPASSAYGRDDCSWCSDGERFACKEHGRQVMYDPPRGMSMCAIFPAIARFAHMFLKWVPITPATNEKPSRPAAAKS